MTFKCTTMSATYVKKTGKAVIVENVSTF